MADTDKPMSELTETEKKINPPKNELFREDPTPEPEPDLDAAARLRAFEDKHLGKDAVRINGHVERGIGSAYHLLVQKHPARQAQYEAIERLVVSEQKLADAHTALIQADVEHEEAMAAAARAESEADAPPAA